jgi:hypothetical protein
MELKFEELDNPIQETSNQDASTNEVNYINYWSNANQSTTNSATKKPKVSYDDILSSLNMVVHNGVLQFAKPIEQKTQKPQQKKQVTINAPQKQSFQEQQPQSFQHQKPQSFQQNQQNKNNYITNKYFKDYKDESQYTEEPEKPMTKEEYRQMLIQEYINRQNAIRRISQIKSKKLLFNTQNISIAPNNNPRDMNKLFSTFRR